MIGRTELEGKIADAILEAIMDVDGFDVAAAEADRAILAIPEIAEAASNRHDKEMREWP